MATDRFRIAVCWSGAVFGAGVSWPAGPISASSGNVMTLSLMLKPDCGQRCLANDCLDRLRHCRPQLIVPAVAADPWALFAYERFDPPASPRGRCRPCFACGATDGQNTRLCDLGLHRGLRCLDLYCRPKLRRTRLVGFLRPNSDRDRAFERLRTQLALRRLG